MEVDIADHGDGSLVELTEAENELYDRQIRLWGLESQKRLRTAKVLVSGLSGIGAEVTKNIILSGVQSVKLHDDVNVTEDDFCSQFLVSRASLGKNRAEASIERARALNPMVEISADTQTLWEKDEDFFAQFDVVVVCSAAVPLILRVDGICCEVGIKFFAADVWGMFGFCFADLQKHKFIEDHIKFKVLPAEANKKAKIETVTTTEEREINYPKFSDVMDFDFNSDAFQKKLKRTGPAFIVLQILQEFRQTFHRDPSYKTRESDLAEIEKIRNEQTSEAAVPLKIFDNVFSQISPTSAVVGGVLAQEVIKVISKKEAPHCNFFLFDPETCCGFVETIGVK